LRVVVRISEVHVLAPRNGNAGPDGASRFGASVNGLPLISSFGCLADAFLHEIFGGKEVMPYK
jgi:hypothetical protein